MQKLIAYNWLALTAISLLVGIYISIFESFFKDKGYLYIILTLIFGALYLYKKKKGPKPAKEEAVSH
jgi:hypothetical protein